MSKLLTLGVLQQGTLLSLSLPFTIDGVTGAISDFIIPLNLHKGQNLTGDTTGRDIFLNNKCKSDFSDVKFLDADNNELEYYIHNHGNYEILPDSTRFGSIHLILPDNSILMTDQNKVAVNDDGIYRSVDGGENWTKVYNGWAYLSWVDSVGNAFATSYPGYKFLRSDYTDTARTSWVEVFDFSAVSGYVTPMGIDEDADGNLYMGRYQSANNVAIYKSTDRGLTWVLKYNQTTQQHVHSIRVDKNVTPNAIYAGVDGTPNLILKSVDAGETWVKIVNDTGLQQLKSASFNDMLAGVGYRIFAVEANIGGGWTLFRTTDDILFEPVLNTRHQGLILKKHDGKIFATCGGNAINRYPAVFMSEDEGLTWKDIWSHVYYVSANNSQGLRYISDLYTPASGDSFMIIGPIDSKFNSSRLYVGGNHYQATAMVKIPSLTVNMSIKIKTASIPSGSNVDIFDHDVPSGLVARYKCNEGTGTVVTDSVSAANGTLTIGSGSWSEIEGKRAGWHYPFIKQTGKSIYFDNTVINITNTAALSITKGFTFCAWVKRVDTTVLMCIVSKGNKLPFCLYGEGLMLRTDTAGNPSRSSLTSGGIVFPIVIDSDLQWHLVGMWVSNDTLPVVRFGIDGLVEDVGQALSGDPGILTDNLTIGKKPDGQFPFKGYIDDVMIYNREITSLEFREIFENRPLLATEPTIVV